MLESIDKTWIISGQSPVQKELLNKHPSSTPLRVEGGDFVWLRDQFVNYFVLKADRDETCNWVPPKENEGWKLFFKNYLLGHILTSDGLLSESKLLSEHTLDVSDSSE